MTAKQFLSMLATEAANTLRRPWRVLKAFRPGGVSRFVDFQRARFRSLETWTAEAGGNALERRSVRSYDDYVELQRSKLQFMDLESHEARFRAALSRRLSELPFVVAGATVICLAARLGAEVRAFRDLGLFAVGIDLNPGPNNDAVLYGDFHDLQFPAGSTTIVYTNSLDHAWELEKVLGEVARILRPDGRLIVEADPGTEEGSRVKPDIWQTLAWKRVDDLVASIEALGFRLETRRGYEYPRGGQQLVFERGRGQDSTP